MRIEIKSQVGQPKDVVAAGFTVKLFEALNPPFPKARVERFDGCETGHQVHLLLLLGITKQRWVSHITQHGNTADEWFFIDEGHTLPFFLKKWRHHHRVLAHPEGSVIVDDITYSTGFRLFDWLMWPALYAQFLYRKPVYKRFFKNAP